MSVCVVSFSARKNGNCAQIGNLIRSLTDGAKLYDFSEFAIHPCGACGYECFSAREACPYIEDKAYEIIDEITKSDLTYFIVPNYCDYPCSNFFAFNERSQCYFQGRAELLDAYERVPKKVIVVSNTNEENFKTAMSYHAEAAPDMLFLPAKKYGRVSIKGDLLSSEKAVSDISAFVRQSPTPPRSTLPMFQV